MAKSKLVEANEKIAEKVVDTYKKIEDTVVDGYTKIEDAFVDRYLTKEGESVLLQTSASAGLSVVRGR